MKRYAFLIGCLFASNVLALSPTNFLFRQKISFPGYTQSEVLTNFPALVVFDETLNNVYHGMAASNAGDLRFSDETLTNELNYEVETWNPAGESFVWVQVPALSNGACIYAYWSSSTQTNPPAYTTNGGTWSEGYTAVWHFAADASDSAQSHDGALMGDPTFLDNGVVDGALNLDGVGDFLNAGPGFADFTGGITVEAWARTEAYRNWSRIIDFGNAAGVDNILLARIGVSDDLRWEFHDTPALNVNEIHDVIGAPIYALNQWQHFVATVEGGANDASLSLVYRDGIEIGRKPDHSPPVVVNRTL
ncbi:MAG: DUF2341 domain-containing protein, partial [Verrucomicrobiota bacterium]